MLTARLALLVPMAIVTAFSRNTRFSRGYTFVTPRHGPSDCRNLLTDIIIGGRMPERNSPSSRPSPDQKLVKVFDTEQENEAIVVQGLLESAGIESDLKSIDAVQDAFPGVGGTVILVREQDAPEAKRIIEARRQLPPIDDETAEMAG
jgi:hypothetical protein